MNLRYSIQFRLQCSNRDNFGNQTGFNNNLIQIDIPGSVPLVVDNGSETPPYGYSLSTDNYSVVLNDFAEDTVEHFFLYR